MATNDVEMNTEAAGPSGRTKVQIIQPSNLLGQSDPKKQKTADKTMTAVQWVEAYERALNNLRQVEAAGVKEGPIRTYLEGLILTNDQIHQIAVAATTEGEGEGRSMNFSSKCLRDNILLFIICSVRFIVTFMMKKSINDVPAHATAINEFRTAYNILRQRSNSNSGKLESKVRANAANRANGIDLNQLLEQITRIAIWFGLPFTNAKGKKNHWYGTALPLIAYFSIFKNRMAEVRTGAETLMIQTKDDKGKPVVVSRNITKLGMRTYHAPLAHGWSFPPQIRGSIARSIGPAALMGCIILDHKSQFAAKYKDALVESVKFIPGIATILDTIFKNKDKKNTDFCITLIMDIAMLMTPRTVRKGSPPICMLYGLVKPALLAIFTATESTHQAKQAGPVLEHPFSWEQYVDFCIHNFDLSNQGLFNTIQANRDNTFLGPEGVNADLYREAVFHATFGTMYEEQTVLHKLTSYANWHTRQQMREAFQKMGQANSTMEFKLISPVYGSKLASACLTDLSPTSHQQIIATPTFSGKQTQPVMAGTIEELDNAMPASGEGLNKVDGCRTFLHMFFIKLLERVRKRKGMMYGTTNWYRVDSRLLSSCAMKGFMQEGPETFQSEICFFHALDKHYKRVNDPDDEKHEKKMKAHYAQNKDWT